MLNLRSHHQHCHSGLSPHHLLPRRLPSPPPCCPNALSYLLLEHSTHYNQHDLYKVQIRTCHSFPPRWLSILLSLVSKILRGTSNAHHKLAPAYPCSSIAHAHLPAQSSEVLKWATLQSDAGLQNRHSHSLKCSFHTLYPTVFLGMGLSLNVTSQEIFRR